MMTKRQFTMKLCIAFVMFVMAVPAMAQTLVREYDQLKESNFQRDSRPANAAEMRMATDACASAGTLTVDGGCDSYTTNSFSLQGGESTDCVTSGGGVSLETAWFRFNTGSNTTLNMSWFYTNSPNCFPGIVVWGPFASGAGCLPSGASVTCLNIQNGDPGYHQQLTGLTTNSDYLIQVVGRNCGGGNDRFIDGCVGIYSVPSNNTNGGPELIDQCGLTFNGTNAGYTQSNTTSPANLDNNAATQCPGCITAGTDVAYAINNDSWFYFCAANAGSWQVDLSGIANCELGIGVQMTLFRGNVNALTWIEDAPSPSAPASTWTSNTFAVSAGECIYMVVDGFSGDQCDYAYELTNVSGGCIILPVAFVSFEAKSQGTGTSLKWSTASEQDASYYLVERSLDGINFEPINRIEAVGNTNTVTNYQSFDENPPAGTLYYRISQTDFDDARMYSEIQAVNIKESGSVDLKPNPARNSTSISFKAKVADDGRIVVRSLTGQEVMSVDVAINEGDNTFTLSVAGLSNGMYAVEVQSRYAILNSRLVVDHK